MKTSLFVEYVHCIIILTVLNKYELSCFAVGVPKTATSTREAAVPHGADKGCRTPSQTNSHAADGDRAETAEYGGRGPR